MRAEKSSGSATGTWGTVQFDVVGTTDRVIIMWSIPYDQNSYKNYLAVGVYKTSDSSTKST